MGDLNIVYCVCALLCVFIVKQECQAKITYGAEAQKLCKGYKKVCPRGKTCAIQTIQWPRFMKFPVCVHTHHFVVRSGVCEEVPSVGGCDAQFRRWYFNVHTAACSWFTYSGCGGNSNNFRSREECETICVTGKKEDIRGQRQEVDNNHRRQGQEFGYSHQRAYTQLPHPIPNSQVTFVENIPHTSHAPIAQHNYMHSEIEKPHTGFRTSRQLITGIDEVRLMEYRQSPVGHVSLRNTPSPFLSSVLQLAPINHNLQHTNTSDDGYSVTQLSSDPRIKDVHSKYTNLSLFGIKLPSVNRLMPGNMQPVRNLSLWSKHSPLSALHVSTVKTSLVKAKLASSYAPSAKETMWPLEKKPDVHSFRNGNKQQETQNMKMKVRKRGRKSRKRKRHDRGSWLRNMGPVNVNRWDDHNSTAWPVTVADHRDQRGPRDENYTTNAVRQRKKKKRKNRKEKKSGLKSVRNMQYYDQIHLFGLLHNTRNVTI